MDNWKQVIAKGIVPGTIASLTSTGALALRSHQESGSMFAGANAISHWLWGDKAFGKDAPTWKYTLVGYAIHHASAHFWASIFEQVAGKVLDKRKPGVTVAAAVAAAGVACFVDYQLTPQRLKPGYEERVSKPSLALVYGAFAIGLAAGAWFNHRRH
ncbi:hypothetical protein IP92_05102 [Pseudoduganella flava]|uniref:DUF1440 domain-containing protein n=1 Tax=Pseudoduganella flava TaxID=871742 RepID=A0A562PGH3_9BURK|nr:hypothetical protein [Pseudoduganella flava]QGZ40348.1 hypothetical protein GO485_15655 [Pseudoduganella flava]TWI43537.1 hypothetical protein IP92_05102 [Pseudoduganella flava]